VAAWSMVAGLAVVQTAGGASGLRSTAEHAIHMPSPTRLQTIQVLPFNGIRLTPPPSGAKPKVSATQAWRVVGRLPASGRYRLVLVEWHSKVPLQFDKTPFVSGLVWAVEGQNVRFPILGGPGGSKRESALWPVNATTGQAYGELGY
jgi:hypothetical protein